MAIPVYLFVGFLEAGKIVGTHGIRGELRVEPWCDSADFLTGFKTLYWNGGETPVKVLGARVHKSLVLMKLEGVESATQGDLLRGKVLYLARKDAKLPEGRYFIQDLIGHGALPLELITGGETITDAR